MTTDCFIQDIEQVTTETSQTLESYERTVNVILDAINYYQGILDNLSARLIKMNLSIGNLTGNEEQIREINNLSKELISKLRKLIGKAKRNSLYPGYKTSLKELSLAVDDFEEHIFDFNFRHNSEIQNNLTAILSGYSLSL